MTILVHCAALLLASSAACAAAGPRPYEMEWAGRDRDTRPPLIDFERVDRWRVETRDAAAEFGASQEQRIWDAHVGKLTYRGAGSRPCVIVRPPAPLAVPAGCDSVTLWVYGNRWAYASDPSTPAVEVAVLLRAGSAPAPEVRLSLGQVRWKEWWVMHRRLTRDEADAIRAGAEFVGIEIAGGRNEEDRVLYFDNLALYREELRPLKFLPQPRRGIELFPGQSPGVFTGSGRLPFPTREETILPDNLARASTSELVEGAGAFEFRYAGADGRLIYRYRPETGTLGDITALWSGQDRAAEFRPLTDGGIALAAGDRESAAVPPGKGTLVRCSRAGDELTAAWTFSPPGGPLEVCYRFRLLGKSLVVDVHAPGGAVGEVRFGRATGLEAPRLVTVPFLTGSARARPAIVVAGEGARPLFVSALIDHFRSNASELFFENGVGDEGATFNGGARYWPKTDARRNDCYERLFLTVAPRFEEVLPNIANPPSPWKRVTGERVWIAHGASDRQRDLEYWKGVTRRGMTQVLVTDHETGWRDGGESFTLRTRAAPGKGGDEAQALYAKRMRALGLRYGIYNNYRDFAPVNEHWDEDAVVRLPSGEWMTAWARCYALKPSRALELEARIAPVIQHKFNLDTAYCDVHTAVTPWATTDADARVPGAARFADVLYAYGAIMLHQKAAWNGPVYSEGNNHWYYCGLTDGNYGQDQAAHLDRAPWLVDFDLRKLHPLCSNFGMGNPGMFYGRDQGLGADRPERETRLDRFLAATLAFGHTGFLVREGGTPMTFRSYYSVQQLHARYAGACVRRIRYADERGRMLDSSGAIGTGAYRLSRVAIEYDNGVRIFVNGNPERDWVLPEAHLPPNGWYAEDTTRGDLEGFSALVRGARVDWVESPAYRYGNGRGRFTRFDGLACDGQLAAVRRDDGAFELIPEDETRTMAVALGNRDGTAEALDEQRRTLGAAPARFARGMLHVLPVPGAVSYRVRPGAAPAVILRCPRVRVVPGERVTISGRAPHEHRVPSDARPGERLWVALEDAWIDFGVVPLVEPTLDLRPNTWRLLWRANNGTAIEGDVRLGSQSRTIRLEPDRPGAIEFPRTQADAEGVAPIALHIAAGELEHRQQWWIKAEKRIVPVADWPDAYVAGQRLRGGAEEPPAEANRAAVRLTKSTCGGEERPSLFMHPPYVGGMGYAFARVGPIRLPHAPGAALRCDVGKADGSDVGDGIVFRIVAADPDGTETLAAEKTWARHGWTPLEADLSRWAGRSVTIKLVVDPGNNTSGDWACWSRMRLESAQPVLVETVHDHEVELQYAPGPHPLSGVTVAQLRQAHKAILRYQGIGLQCGGAYISRAELNGIDLGPLPGAAGSETGGTWADASLALPDAATKTLSNVNQLTIRNPAGDCFKVRRFRLDLELADGRRVSSRIRTGVITQPPDWLHAEGETVPADRPIEVEIRF